MLDLRHRPTVPLCHLRPRATLNQADTTEMMHPFGNNHDTTSRRMLTLLVPDRGVRPIA